MKLNLKQSKLLSKALKLFVVAQAFNAVADVAVWFLYGWLVPSWAFGVLIAYTGLVTWFIMKEA